MRNSIVAKSHSYRFISHPAAALAIIVHDLCISDSWPILHAVPTVSSLVSDTADSFPCSDRLSCQEQSPTLIDTTYSHNITQRACASVLHLLWLPLYGKSRRYGPLAAPSALQRTNVDSSVFYLCMSHSRVFMLHICVQSCMIDVQKDLDYDSFRFACFGDFMRLLLCGCLKAVAKVTQGNTFAEARGEGHVTAQGLVSSWTKQVDGPRRLNSRCVHLPCLDPYTAIYSSLQSSKSLARHGSSGSSHQPLR